MSDVRFYKATRNPERASMEFTRTGELLKSHQVSAGAVIAATEYTKEDNVLKVWLCDEDKTTRPADKWPVDTIVGELKPRDEAPVKGITPIGWALAYVTHRSRLLHFVKQWYSGNEDAPVDIFRLGYEARKSAELMDAYSPPEDQDPGPGAETVEYKHGCRVYFTNYVLSVPGHVTYDGEVIPGLMRFTSDGAAWDVSREHLLYIAAPAEAQ